MRDIFRLEIPFNQSVQLSVEAGKAFGEVCFQFAKYLLNALIETCFDDSRSARPSLFKMLSFLIHLLPEAHKFGRDLLDCPCTLVNSPQPYLEVIPKGASQRFRGVC